MIGVGKDTTTNRMRKSETMWKEKLFLWYMVQTSDITPWSQDPRNGGHPWPPVLEAYTRGGRAQHAEDVWMENIDEPSTFL
jgi:hypothetical protein